MGKASKSSISKELSILRVKSEDTMVEMARRLGVSSHALRQIESGKKECPDTLMFKILTTYSKHITSEDQKRLYKAYEDSKLTAVFDLTKIDKKKRDMLLLLNEVYEKLDDRVVKKITDILI